MPTSPTTPSRPNAVEPTGIVSARDNEPAQSRPSTNAAHSSPTVDAVDASSPRNATQQQKPANPVAIRPPASTTGSTTRPTANSAAALVSGSTSKTQGAQPSLPAWACCPLSKKPLDETSVVAPDGETYRQEAIVEYLENNNRQFPNTQLYSIPADEPLEAYLSPALDLRERLNREGGAQNLLTANDPEHEQYCGPLSLDTMHDPIIDSHGHKYDLSLLQDYFNQAEDSSVSPINRQRLEPIIYRNKRLARQMLATIPRDKLDGITDEHGISLRTNLEHTLSSLSEIDLSHSQNVMFHPLAPHARHPRQPRRHRRVLPLTTRALRDFPVWRLAVSVGISGFFIGSMTPIGPIMGLVGFGAVLGLAALVIIFEAIATSPR